MRFKKYLQEEKKFSNMFTAGINQVKNEDIKDMDLIEDEEREDKGGENV
jgi:hypothetical protein